MENSFRSDCYLQNSFSRGDDRRIDQQIILESYRTDKGQLLHDSNLMYIGPDQIFHKLKASKIRRQTFLSYTKLVDRRFGHSTYEWYK